MGTTITIGPPASRRASGIVGKHDIALCWTLVIVGVVVGATLVWAGAEIEGGAAAVLSFAPLYWCLDRRLFPGLFLGPFVMMGVLHELGYALSPLWEIHVVGTLSAIKEGLAPAQWGAAIGLATIALVFPPVFRRTLRGAPRASVHRAAATPATNWNAYGLCLLAIGILLLGYGFRTGVANRLNPREVSLLNASTFSAFQLTHQVMFFFLGFSAARFRRFWIALWATVFFAYATFFFLDGGRGGVAIAILLSVVGFVWGGASRRTTTIVLLAFLGVFAPLAGVVRIYRDAYTSEVETFQGRVNGLGQAWDDFSTSRRSVGGSTEAIAWALTAKSVDYIFILVPDDIPFVGFSGLSAALYSIVPQILMPNRPDLVDGNAIAIEYGAAPRGSQGSYMPTVGDGYRRFGWLGILFLYLILTVIYGVAFGFCWARRSNCEHAAMLVFLLVQALGIWSSSFVNVVYLAVWVFPKYFLFFWLVGRIQRMLSLRARKREDLKQPVPELRASTPEGWVASTPGSAA